MFENDNDKNKLYFPFTPICNNFIENYMKNSNPSFVVIYIYLLKSNFIGNNITTAYVAQQLQILQADVLTALKFWEEKGAITYHIDEEDFININFLKMEDNYKKVDFGEKDPIKIKSPERPIYTDDEVEFYTDKEEIKQLFKMAERIFAKTFSYTDKLVILGLYDWLGLSMEVLAVLFTYCSTNGKTNLRYIEKTAINWVEMGINSTQKAEEYIKLFSNEYKDIMASLGIKNREPVDVEINFMKTWTIDLKMPLEIIKEACYRTVLKTGQSSFKYANSIIKIWHKSGVKTFEDIKQLDKNFDQKQKEVAEREVKRQNINVRQAPQIRPNKFINYKQPEYDFKKLRELEIKRLKERAKE